MILFPIRIKKTPYYRLQLDEKQTAELARILDDLKIERAQVAVDERRAVSAFADALSADVLDSAKLADAGASRVRSAERSGTPS